MVTYLYTITDQGRDNYAKLKYAMTNIIAIMKTVNYEHSVATS